jgi:ABC-type sugar transport system permease subunit
MGKQKEQVKDMWNGYMDWLDHISTYVDTPVKVRNLIIRNGKKIVMWIFIVTTIWTMIGVYMQGECLNCEKLTQEEAYKILNDSEASLKYVSDHIYVSFTSFKTYLHYLKLPLFFTWLTNILVISSIVIFFNVIKKIIMMLGIKNDPVIKIPKIKRK